MNEILETPRLILTPFTAMDGPLLHLIFTNAHIRKYLWDDQPISREQAEEIIEQNDRFFTEDQWGLWKVLGKVTTETIGFVGLWPFFGESQPQLIYGIMPDFVRRGFAMESAGKVIEYAFENLNFKYVDASTDQPNLASQKVAEGLGMTPLREEKIENKPTLFYRITAKEYNQLKQNTYEFTKQQP